MIPVTTNDNIKRVAAFEVLTLECRRYMSDLEDLLCALHEHGVPPQAWLSFEGGQVSDDIKVTAKWTKAVVVPPIPRSALPTGYDANVEYNQTEAYKAKHYK